MHAETYRDCPVADEIAFAKAAALDRLVLGSQRALQFGGEPIRRKHARLYNCTTSYCDRPRFFQEALWLLLCGSGVGFSVQRHHVAKLPDLNFVHDAPVSIFEIPDTIEGWADALGVLLATYGIASPEFSTWIGRRVRFDFSLIRPKGSSLSSGSGKAPGPDPLRSSLDRIEALLDRCVSSEARQTRLRSIDCYDIIMHASDAVLSGGVRRSATICVFSPDDRLMIEAKTGKWFNENPQRGRSNNSAMLLRSQTSREEFGSFMKYVKECGEPGFVWADSTEILYNPCVEIGLYPQDEHGRSGWAFCNLCEINVKACRTPEEFARACKAAAILGTFQAGYTRFDYLGPISEEIARREALLGVSMTGMMDNPKIAFDPGLQRAMAQLILEVNAKVAKKIGINSTARATCVKPAGTTSCMLGTASGIHPHHASRYFRRVQANKLEIPYQYFEAHNPRAVEDSFWNPNGTDAVLTFCVEVPKEALTHTKVNAMELLRHVKLTQDNWVAYGRNPDRCAQPWLRHNVSNTITVRDHEWGPVTDFIYDNRESFAGISILPYGGDLDYVQAPFCAVWTAEEIIAEYGAGAMMASGLIVDGQHAFSNDLWAACSTAMGTGKLPSNDYQADWVRRAKQFAARYFAGDLKRTTYCLKRTSCLKLWCDLQREAIPVDYKLMPESTDSTKLSETVACGGRGCEL
jgi:ribonucleoside-diphosphate reductase alpha chain